MKRLVPRILVHLSTTTRYFHSHELAREAVWAKTFRDWMKHEQPQFIEAENERACHVSEITPTAHQSTWKRFADSPCSQMKNSSFLHQHRRHASFIHSKRQLLDEFEHTLKPAVRMRTVCPASVLPRHACCTRSCTMRAQH